MTDLDALRQISKEVAAVIVQYPNFLGSIEDLAEIKAIAEENGALFIVSANPLALALLQAQVNSVLILLLVICNRWVSQ